MKAKPKKHEGVREIKRRETHRRITETALKLFVENGYEVTTLDAIAEASEIARRTFFHYFNSKEEIILGWQSALPEALHAEMLKQDRRAPALAITQAALAALAANMQPDVAAMISRIVQSNEQLRVRNQAKFLQMELAAYNGLRELLPDAKNWGGLRLAAMVGIGVMRLSIDCWILDEGQRPLSGYLEENFNCLKIELGSSV